MIRRNLMGNALRCDGNPGSVIPRRAACPPPKPAQGKGRTTASSERLMRWSHFGSNALNGPWPHRKTGLFHYSVVRLRKQHGEPTEISRC